MMDVRFAKNKIVSAFGRQSSTALTLLEMMVAISIMGIVL
jgi:prepilin-type N-terminal cleavage/methylation domain-containing protein